MKKSITSILCLSLFIFLAVPLTSFAQMQEGGEGKGGMMGEGMMGGGMPMMQMMQKMMGMHGMDAGMQGGTLGVMEMMKMMQSMSSLNLSPDQKKKIETLKLKHQKEAIPLLSKTEMANVEIKELTLADPVDLEKMRAKVKEKHTAMADLEVSHLALAQQMKGILTPEQRQKMESMMIEMGTMMGMGMMGGPAGKGKADGGAQAAPKAAPKAPEEAPAEGADPHGH
jgi:Spy/CpxP family protein refolding chaperone